MELCAGVYTRRQGLWGLVLEVGSYPEIEQNLMTEVTVPSSWKAACDRLLTGEMKSTLPKGAWV